MMQLSILALVGGLLLEGCASTSTSSSLGNERGGSLDRWGLTPFSAQAKADAHCAQYGKAARLRNQERQGTGTGPVVFDCVEAGPSGTKGAPGRS